MSVSNLLCAAATLVVPDLAFGHGWLALFGTPPPMNAAGLGCGVAANVAVAWIAAVLFVGPYNALHRQQGPAAG